MLTVGVAEDVERVADERPGGRRAGHASDAVDEAPALVDGGQERRGQRRGQHQPRRGRRLQRCQRQRIDGGPLGGHRAPAPRPGVDIQLRNLDFGARPSRCPRRNAHVSELFRESSSVAATSTGVISFCFSSVPVRFIGS